MNTAGTAAVVTGVGVGAAIAVAGRARARARRGREEHWLAVTVNREPDSVGPEWPEPLARLGGRIEVRTRQAAGGKGTEVLARPAGDGVSREELRMALRQSKSLIEAGTVVCPHSPSTTHPGPAGKVLSMVVRKSRGEGRL